MPNSQLSTDKCHTSCGKIPPSPSVKSNLPTLKTASTAQHVVTNNNITDMGRSC